MRHSIQGMFLLAAVAAVPAFGQSGPGPGPGDVGGPRARGGSPPFQQRPGASDADLKDALDVSDEQWNALQPKIARVQELHHDAAAGRGGMPGMGMGGGPGMGRPDFAMAGPPDRRGEPRHGPGNRGDRGARGGPATRPSGAHGPATRPVEGGRALGTGDPHDPDHGGGPGGRGGFGPGMGSKPSKVMERFLDLQEALDDKDAKPQDLRAKIDALHQARDEARAELAKAQVDLRGAVTPNQEAVLITMGVLD